MGNIGRHYYNWRYNGQGRDPQPGTTPVPVGSPIAPPAATPMPTQVVACDAPPSVSSTVEPACGPAGTTFVFTIFGFQPNEPLSFWFTDPEGFVAGTEEPLDIPHNGGVELPLPTDDFFTEGV